VKGYIGFEHHKIECVVGVYPHEHKEKQLLYVDLQVESDFTACSLSDDVKDTVNYELLAALCTELAVTKQYRLLETFAVDVLNAIFFKFDVSWAWIRIKKPLGLPSATYSIVELERFKDE